MFDWAAGKILSCLFIGLLDQTSASQYLKYRSYVCKQYLICHCSKRLTIEQANDLGAENKINNIALAKSGKRRHSAQKWVTRIPGPLIQIEIPDHLNSKHHVLGLGRNYHHQTPCRKG